MRRVRSYKPRPPKHRDAKASVTRIDRPGRTVYLRRGDSVFRASMPACAIVQVVRIEGDDTTFDRAITSVRLLAELADAARAAWASPYRADGEEDDAHAV